MNTPQHVAIIMDGNGRWAQQRGQARTSGHRKGVEAVRQAVKSAGELGIRYLTLFAFSAENWRRPQDEVNDLMNLLKIFVRRDLAELHRENVRVRVIGDRKSLKSDILALRTEASPDKGGFNSGYYSNPKVDELLEAARRSTDQDERAKLYKEMQEIVQEDAPWAFIANWKQNAVTSDRVSGFKLQPSFFLLLGGVSKS